MADPYQILGVQRDAAPDAIRKAYLRLAKKHHPDLNPSDKGAEARFKEIGTAYDIVGDATRRAKFDKGEIDATGAERPPQPERGTYRHHAEAQPDFKYGQQYSQSWGPQSGDADHDLDAFAEFFRARGGPRSTRGADINYTFSVDFIEAATGAKKRVVMGDGRTLDITIPAGLRDGQTLRLRGQGHVGANGAAAGDALVEIHVTPHPHFQRDNLTIRSTLRVTLGEALGGAKVPVATLAGPVSLAIPKGSDNGAVLRLRGKGIAAGGEKGDHLVTLQVVLPKDLDDALVRAIVDWEAKHPTDPRQDHDQPRQNQGVPS